MESIEQARAHVQECITDALAWADSGEPRTLWEYEKRSWRLLLALGRALVALFLVRHVARPRPVTYKRESKRWVLRDWRTSDLGTLFGKVSFSRPVGRRESSRRAAADLVVDRELGLCSGFSLGVVAGMARLTAQMPFETARGMWRDTYGWAPSSRATLRMVDAGGEQARAFLEEAPAPDDDGEILVLQVDAGGAPMVSHAELERRRRPKRKGQRKRTRRDRKARRRERRRERPGKRRTKGQKSFFFNDSLTSVIYTLARTSDGELEGPVNKRIIGTFESHEALFIWLHREAVKRGYGSKPTIFIADGSEHIWRLQQHYLPEAEPCLDWYHLSEYVWKAGRSFHREGSPELQKWVHAQLDQLWKGQVAPVLDELRERLKAIPRTGPGNKGRRERLEQVIGYMEKHRSRMPYDSFLDRGFDIGSGAVEGAIRNAVRMRLDGPGCRWGRTRSERVLQLRCVLLNEQWDDFCAYLVANGLNLPAKPEPARPHTAKKKAA